MSDSPGLREQRHRHHHRPVIDSVRAWVLLPELVSRPVIVCLWGLTGTGKTQLVRRLAQLLGFYDRFVEVQMDGFSHGAGFRAAQSIPGMLAESGVREREPGILLLDEFQRFRTIDKKRDEVRVERYQDVWALLSDGRLPPALSLLADIESSISEAAFEAERADADDAKMRFKLRPWQAQELQRQLKLEAPLMEIMAWTPAQLQQQLRTFRDNGERQWETDYSLLLVFVCGNLDEMYSDLATSVDDCDSDADVFHALTAKLSVIDVKQALNKRFKPEQVARLGNEHVICPSLSRCAYEQLIEQGCARYARHAATRCGLHFELGSSVREPHRHHLLALVDELMDQGQVTPAHFVAVTGLALGRPEDALDPFADGLAAFRVAAHGLPQRVPT